MNFNPKVSSHFWIGINDAQEEGKWVYSSDGTEVEGANRLGETLSDWNNRKNDDGNPDAQDCAYWWEGYGGGWWDTACTAGNDPEFNYVCEKGTTSCPNEFDTYNDVISYKFSG